jgi:hypothetical protein
LASGIVQLPSTAINLRAQIGELGDLLRHSLGSAITLEIRADTQLWPLRADPVQLEMTLLNLAINARDAMPHGGTVTLTLENCCARSARSCPSCWRAATCLHPSACKGWRWNSFENRIRCKRSGTPSHGPGNGVWKLLRLPMLNWRTI